MKKLFYISIFILSLMGMSSVLAVPTAGLYSATIPVASQAPQLQKTAMIQAFGQVLIKVSGNSSILNNPKIKNVLANANTYVQQFGYRQITPVMPNQGTLALHVSFNAKMIDQLLTSSGQSIWEKNRPAVLIWLMVTEPQNGQMVKYLISNDNPKLAQQLLMKDAENRGLPVLLPILDLQDLQTVSMEDVQQINLAKISQASNRYTSDAILVGNISSQDGQHWQAQWALSSNGKQSNWSFSGNALDAVLGQGINQVIYNVANNLTVNLNNTQQQQLQLTVNNVNNLDDYAKVMKVLQQFSMIKEMNVVKVTPSSVIFNLQILGDTTTLEQAMRLEHHLKAMLSTEDNSGLQYQWIS